MKTLSGSCWKLFASNQTEKVRVFRCSTEIAPSRRQIGFLVHQKRVTNGFSPAVSFQLKRVPSISAVSSSAQSDVESEEIQIISPDKPKTVRVRIKLLKECTFGEQFFVVGDDPIFGLWDPSEGVPLDWSEGHVWTAEVDIPIGKVIKYKFILKGIIGAILWQPGTDRVLKTWETEKIISVSEDWDNPDFQNIVEEDFVDALLDLDLNQTLVKEGDNAVDKLESIPSEELEEQDLSSSDEGSVTVSEETSSLKDETTLVLDEGVPVLVPGLVPALVLDEDVPVPVENTITESDEIKDSAESEQQNGEETSPEGNGVRVPTVSLHSTEMVEVMVDEKQQYGEEQTESNILGSDVQWGRRTLQKFLSNLGFI